MHRVENSEFFLPHSKMAKIPKNQNSEPPKLSKLLFFDTLKSVIVISRKIQVEEKS